MRRQKGFTIIELIVAIAIIAVLAAIVVVNVTSYANKSKDAAVKSDLHNMITGGVDYFYNTGSYLSFRTTATSPITDINSCVGSSGFNKTCTAIINAGYTITSTCAGATCDSTSPTPTAWCALVNLKSNSNTYCVESTGKKLEKVSGSCANGICN